jgi:hypothetical protein
MAIPDTSVVRPLLDNAKQISILLPQKPQFDSVAAALGLKISLDVAGKSSRVICPDSMLVEFNRLVGVESISNTFGSRNLIISFPGQTEHVDKVSYNLDSGELQLVITPKPDAPDLDHQKVRFTSATGKQDIIFMMGISDLRELGPVHDQIKDTLQTTTVISISHTPQFNQYTLHQLHDYDSSSLSELTTHIIDLLGLSLDVDASSNLLFGLEKATASFKSAGVSVTTFEAAAKLMRKGAKRHVDEISASDYPTGSIPVDETTELAPDQIPVEKPKTNGKKAAPADWFEPKIYKGPLQP